MNSHQSDNYNSINNNNNNNNDDNNHEHNNRHVHRFHMPKFTVSSKNANNQNQYAQLQDQLQLYQSKDQQQPKLSDENIFNSEKNVTKIDIHTSPKQNINEKQNHSEKESYWNNPQIAWSACLVTAIILPLLTWFIALHTIQSLMPIKDSSQSIITLDERFTNINKLKKQIQQTHDNNVKFGLYNNLTMEYDSIIIELIHKLQDNSRSQDGNNNDDIQNNDDESNDDNDHSIDDSGDGIKSSKKQESKSSRQKESSANKNNQENVIKDSLSNVKESKIKNNNIVGSDNGKAPLVAVNYVNGLSDAKHLQHCRQELQEKDKQLEKIKFLHREIRKCEREKNSALSQL